MGTPYRNIVRSRKLAERSYLYFKYPTKKGESIEFYLPFMENIEVTETQRPNYATYDLIGRSSSLFAYLGTKSREMTLKFNMTLPNIVDYIQNVGLSQIFSKNFRKLILGLDTSEERKKFLREGSTKNTNITDKLFNYYQNGKADMRQLDSSYVDGSDKGTKSGVRSAFEAVTNFFNSSQDEQSFKIPRLLQNAWFDKDTPKKGYSDINMGEAVNLLMMWVNVIRTSVINNSTKTQYGPPTVYLNHGTMYNNIPCVCTSFSVRLVSNAGYELLSLAPRQVEVTMNLSENRVGNFDDFLPFEETYGDNLTGWESVMTGPGTLDPNNQFLRIYRFNTAEMEAQEDEFMKDLALNLSIAELNSSLYPPKQYSPVKIPGP